MILPPGFADNSPHETIESPALPGLWGLFGVSWMAGIFRLHEAARLVCNSPLAQADQHAIVFVALEVNVWFFRFT